MFPPIPTWDGLHPLIVHFPIALMLVAPVFMMVGLVMPRRGWPFALAALVLMALGTAAMFVAVSSGQAAAELAERRGAIAGVLERHEELAELTRNMFAVLTVIYAAVVLVPRWLPRIVVPARVVMQGLLLAAYLGCLLLLVNTAHQGGRLVHEFGVRAIMTGS